MAKPSAPVLGKMAEKRVMVNLQANRKMSGILRGFDIFMNLVLEDARDESTPGREQKIEGGPVIIRGNSIASLEVISAY